MAADEDFLRRVQREQYPFAEDAVKEVDPAHGRSERVARTVTVVGVNRVMLLLSQRQPGGRQYNVAVRDSKSGRPIGYIEKDVMRSVTFGPGYRRWLAFTLKGDKIGSAPKMASAAKLVHAAARKLVLDKRRARVEATVEEAA